MAKKNAALTRNTVRYQKLPTNDNDGFVDMQFEKPERKIPWKAIALACILFIGGSILILIASLLISGHIDAKYGDRTWPLLILGSIMFIPGAYHVRLAYYAYNDVPGYSFDSIPDFD